MNHKPPNRERYWKAVFGEAAEKYERDYQISLWTEHGLHRRLETCLRILNEHLKGGERILDVGCGPGTYCAILAERGYSVVGIDYSKAVIEKAIEKSKGKHISYSVGEVYSIPFRDSSFDAAICIGVFQHIDNDKEAITELRRILRNESGLLVLITLNSLSIKALYEKIVGLPFGRTKSGGFQIVKYGKRCNPFKLRNMLKQNGYRNVRFQGIYIFPKYARFLEWLFDKLDAKLGIRFLMAAQSFVMVGSVGEER